MAGNAPERYRLVFSDIKNFVQSVLSISEFIHFNINCFSAFDADTKCVLTRLESRGNGGSVEEGRLSETHAGRAERSEG